MDQGQQVHLSEQKGWKVISSDGGRHDLRF